MFTMKVTTLTTSSLLHRSSLPVAALVVAYLGISTGAVAQTPPPIGGLTGTIAMDGTVDAVDAGAQTVVVKTVDGIKHLFHGTRDLLVHGGNGANTLKDLREGTTVAVHYTLAGSEAAAEEIDRIGSDGLRMTEGVVTRVDRGRKEIVIRFDDGRSETYQLTERAAQGVGKDLDRSVSDATRIVVYYTDEAGRKVVHFFKKAS
jgi:hypothetical protein